MRWRVHRLFVLLFVILGTDAAQARHTALSGEPFPRTWFVRATGDAPAAMQCSFSLGETSASVPSTPITRTVSVVTGTSCSWTAVSHVSWITVTGGASGTGLGWVTFSVATNPGSSPRVGTLTIAGITYTVTQGANSCSYTLGETSASLPSTPTTRTVSVVTGTACSWTAVSQVSWITVTGGASGTGLGWVTFSVATNPGSSPRVGTLTIAGIIYTVTQAANSCSYSLGETSASVPASASTRTIAVVTGTACSWTAVSHVSWMTVTGGASGTGLGWVTIGIAANSGGSVRVGTATIAGTIYTVTQAAGSCSYTLSAAGASVPAAASTGTVSVSAAAGCSWTALSNAGWITVTAGASGSGGGVVAYAVAANPGTSPRTGALTIAGQPFSITQAAPPGPTAPRNVRIVP